MILAQLAIFLMVLAFVVMPVTSCAAVRSRSRRFALWGAMAGILAAAVASSLIMDGNLSLALFGYLSLTPLSAFFIFLAASAIALVEILAFRYSERFPEFAFAMSMSFIGMFFIASAQSLLPIMIGLELMTVSTTFMILVHGRKRAEAAVKLFVFGSLAVAIFAFAVSSCSSTIRLSRFPQISGYEGYIAMVSLALFIAALGFETASFPFNLWVPDVMRGPPPLCRPRSPE